MNGAIYALDEFAVNDVFTINAGIRLSQFTQVGPFTRYLKNDQGQTSDTTVYNKGDKIKTYTGFEPRLSMRYALDDESSIKAGVVRNFQYVHRATISGITLPTDLWFPSSDIVQPQIGMQYSIGYFQKLQAG